MLVRILLLMMFPLLNSFANQSAEKLDAFIRGEGNDFSSPIRNRWIGSSSFQASKNLAPTTTQSSKITKKLHFPVAYAGKLPLPVIVLDPGHGGSSVGCKIKYPYSEEKRLSLCTAYLTKRYLERQGYKVILTRYTDVNLSLYDRVKKANRFNAEIFVSIHFNSCPTPKVHGIEIYYSDDENNKREEASKKLAVSVLDSTLKHTGAASRGVRKKDFVVIRDTTMPAILVECGFLTNAEELDKLRQKPYLARMAKGIANGVNAFIEACTQ